MFTGKVKYNSKEKVFHPCHKGSVHKEGTSQTRAGQGGVSAAMVRTCLLKEPKVADWEETSWRKFWNPGNWPQVWDRLRGQRQEERLIH